MIVYDTIDHVHVENQIDNQILLTPLILSAPLDNKDNQDKKDDQEDQDDPDDQDNKDD